MKIYCVSAVDMFADYPYRAETVSYHKSLESATKAADEINKSYRFAKENNWYDENGNPLCNYQSEASIGEIDVLD